MLDHAQAANADRPASNDGNVIAFPGHRPGSIAERARARRDWLMARWAAEVMGLAPAAARSYARTTSSSIGSTDSVVHRIRADFAASGVGLDADAVFRKLDDFHIQADIWARCTAAR